MEKISWKSNSIQMIIKPLDKILKIQNMTIAFKSVFQKDGKYYPQFF